MISSLIMVSFNSSKLIGGLDALSMGAIQEALNHAVELKQQTASWTFSHITCNKHITSSREINFFVGWKITSQVL